jgi:ElaB/YqjD/DUF883 family membrane-anchored ribosome-binding protein
MTDYNRSNPEVLEDEIERSRERISTDIDQLGQRLKPRHMKERAKDALEDKARRAARQLIEVIRSNPVPAAIGAAVTGLLILARNRGGRKRIARRKSRRRT